MDGVATDGSAEGGAGPSTAARAGGSIGALGERAGGAAIVARGPLLLPVADPCAHHFPDSARAPHGDVQVEVRVGPDGRPRGSRILLERPRAEGFGAAAHACSRRLRFAPARTTTGLAVESVARLQLSFDRS